MEGSVTMRPLTMSGLALAVLVAGFALILPTNPPRLAHNPQALDANRPTIQLLTFSIPAGILSGVYDAN